MGVCALRGDSCTRGDSCARGDSCMRMDSCDLLMRMEADLPSERAMMGS